MFKKVLCAIAAVACISLFAFKKGDTGAGEAKKPKPPLKTIIIDPGHGGSDGGAQGAVSREAIIALEISLRLREIMKKELPDVNVLITRERDVLPGGLYNKNAALKWRAEFANQNAGDLFISIHLNASPNNQRTARRQVGTRTETRTYYTGKGKKKKKQTKTVEVPVYERYRLPATIYGTQTYILASDWYNIKRKAVQFGVGKLSEMAGAGGETDSLDQSMLELDPVEARIRASQYTKYFFTKSLTLASFCEEEFAQIGRKSWGVLQRDWDGIWVLQATQMPSILVESGFVDYPEEEAYLHSVKGQEEMAGAILRAVKRYKDMLENPGKYAPVDTANVKMAGK